MSKNKPPKDSLRAKPKNPGSTWSVEKAGKLRKASKQRYPSACDCACK